MFDKKNKLYFPEKNLNNIPISYICPIGYHLMLEPSLNEKNQIYDLKNISNWYYKYKRKTDPLTNCRIKNYSLDIISSLQMEIFIYISQTLFHENKILSLL